MGMLIKPTLTVKENLDSCVTPVVQANFGKAYASVKRKMIADEASYCVRGRTQKMHLFSSSPISEPLGDKARALYDNRMVHKSGTGRVNYAQLRMIADICPYCLERSTETLDHYLPKSSFPLLSITPVNLIPSCDTCNRKKLDDFVLERETSLSTLTLRPSSASIGFLRKCVRMGRRNDLVWSFQSRRAHLCQPPWQNE